MKWYLDSFKTFSTKCIRINDKHMLASYFDLVNLNNTKIICYHYTQIKSHGCSRDSHILAFLPPHHQRKGQVNT